MLLREAFVFFQLHYIITQFHLNQMKKELYLRLMLYQNDSSGKRDRIYFVSNKFYAKTDIILLNCYSMHYSIAFKRSCLMQHRSIVPNS